MPHGRQGWGLCQDKHCPFKGCRRPSNLGKGPLLSEVQQFRADVSLNVPDPLYCKKGDNSYSCLLFLFVCLWGGGPGLFKWHFRYQQTGLPVSWAVGVPVWALL